MYITLFQADQIVILFTFVVFGMHPHPFMGAEGADAYDPCSGSPASAHCIVTTNSFIAAKQQTTARRWLDVGPASPTLAQHRATAGHGVPMGVRSGRHCYIRSWRISSY